MGHSGVVLPSCLPMPLLNLLQQIGSNVANVFTAPIFQLGDSSLSLASFVQVIVTVLLVFYIIRRIRSILANRILSRLNIDAHNREAIATIISYGLGVLGFIIILQTVGFNLASLAVLAGGLGVGIGLGLQSLTVNFVSGINLLLARKLRVGDYVALESMEGYIQEISLQSTVIRTRDGANVVVPNHQLSDSRVINWSYDNYTGRLHLPVGVAYGSDLVLVTEVLLDCAYSSPHVVPEPIPKVIFLGFGSSSIDLELRVWVKQIDLAPDIKSDLYFAMEDGLRQHDVKIPFPQLDLWVQPTSKSENVQPSALQMEMETVAAMPTAAIAPTASVSLKHLLRQVDYFQHLSDVQLRQVIESGYRQHLNDQDTLFRENDPGNAFYIILDGCVEVLSETLNKTLTTLSAGQFFGELSLMLGVPRSATVRAIAPTNLFVINQQGFRQLLAEHPNIYDVLVQELRSHQEELATRQQQLRELGLIDIAEDDVNLMIWVQNRLKRLFKA